MSEAVAVNVDVGVSLNVGVKVAVVEAVGLRVGEEVSVFGVPVKAAVGVPLPGCGANRTATPPRQ